MDPGFAANGSIEPNGSFFCPVGCAAAVAAMPAGFIGRPPTPYPPEPIGAPVVFGSALAMPPIEKVELLALALGFAPVGLEACGAAADLSGALDWAREEPEPPSAEPRRSLKRAGLLACGMPRPEEGAAEDQLRPKMSPTMEVGPDPGPAAAVAAAGDGWWVHDGLALVAGWCVHDAPVAGLVEGLAAAPGRWSRRGREPEEREALMPKSNWYESKEVVVGREEEERSPE